MTVFVVRSNRRTFGHLFFFFQAEDGIRDLVRSRGLGDVYKRQVLYGLRKQTVEPVFGIIKRVMGWRQMSMRGLDKARGEWSLVTMAWNCLLYTSDAADERSSVDLGGRRIIKKKKNTERGARRPTQPDTSTKMTPTASRAHSTLRVAVTREQKQITNK